MRDHRPEGAPPASLDPPLQMTFWTMLSRLILRHNRHWKVLLNRTYVVILAQAFHSSRVLPDTCEKASWNRSSQPIWERRQVLHWKEGKKALHEQDAQIALVEHVPDTYYQAVCPVRYEMIVCQGIENALEYGQILIFHNRHRC